jgi:hypothetical protein
MSQSQYDISGVGYNYDLFDDNMNSTITIGAGGGGGLLGGYNITTSPGTIYTTSTDGAGQTLTWNGVNPVWTTTPPTPLKVNGDAEIDGDLKVKGKSLSEAIENIEKRLAILHPNAELEEKWEELKALGERYRELEKNILEKEKMWDILKK